MSTSDTLATGMVESSNESLYHNAYTLHTAKLVPKDPLDDIDCEI